MLQRGGEELPFIRWSVFLTVIESRAMSRQHVACKSEQKHFSGLSFSLYLLTSPYNYLIAVCVSTQCLERKKRYESAKRSDSQGTASCCFVLNSRVCEVCVLLPPSEEYVLVYVLVNVFSDREEEREKRDQ